MKRSKSNTNYRQSGLPNPKREKDLDLLVYTGVVIQSLLQGKKEPRKKAHKTKKKERKHLKWRKTESAKKSNYLPENHEHWKNRLGRGAGQA